MTDYSNARYFAISGLGYGKGFTVAEAIENYVQTQLVNHRAEDTIFETRPKFEAALREGNLKAEVWLAPEGFTGFMTGQGAHWTREVDGKTEYREFTVEDRVEEVEHGTT